jgi:hypothetical protein
MNSPAPRAGRTAAVAVTLSAALLGSAACSSDLRLKGPAQTTTVTVPATATIKGKQLRFTEVKAGGATVEVGGVVRILRSGDSFTFDDVRFTVDRVDDAAGKVTLTGLVELTWP